MMMTDFFTRVVILHLKRYELNDSYSKYKKKLDTVDVPLEIDLGMTFTYLSFIIALNLPCCRSFPGC